MVKVENVLVSDDLIDRFFCCDLERCKGDCCLEGDAGAPLDPLEISDLEDNYLFFKKYMTPEAIAKIETDGLFDYDETGNFVTPLLENESCVFVYYDHDIAKCAIEKAFLQERTGFIKPISCHLYPIRIKQLPDYDALNYHRWFVCESACKKGNAEKIPVYQFLKTPLIRKYGEKWFQKLEIELQFSA